MEGVNWKMDREAKPVKQKVAPHTEEPTLF
jgi:hypothetical protein